MEYVGCGHLACDVISVVCVQLIHFVLKWEMRLIPPKPTEIICVEKTTVFLEWWNNIGMILDVTVQGCGTAFLPSDHNKIRHRPLARSEQPILKSYI
jgi:hypothetical protein